MARVRAISIRNFRGISALDWFPSSGLNCIIGPGDSGKSTVLDAVDLCIGARRNASFSDADFHALNTEQPISISVTLGELPDAIRSMETYGQFLRGYDASQKLLEDEPGAGLETVLTLSLVVGADLEPAWSIYSERASAQGLARNLIWADRVLLAPTRISGSPDAHLGWRRGSVLNRMSNESPSATAALVKASRDAREAFGTESKEYLAEALATVDKVASGLGVAVSGGTQAFLDARSISFSSGTVALHDGRGVPLAALGTGSARLLVAGLQREAAADVDLVLVDEIEYGLEPHRLIGLLGSLGAKEKDTPPFQVFGTTHSPVAVRELAAHQLSLLLRNNDGSHHVLSAGDVEGVQGTLRLFPEAFLATKIIVCEGASEVGLLRGIDLHLARKGKVIPLAARGVALVDAGGASRLYNRVNAFMALGYKTAAFRDDDVRPTPEQERAFLDAGGMLITWQSGRALEDELFESLPEAAIAALIDKAVELHDATSIEDNLRSASNGLQGLNDRDALLKPEGRALLAKASKANRGWFKSLSWMEEVAVEIIGPHLKDAEAGFRQRIAQLYVWSK